VTLEPGESILVVGSAVLTVVEGEVEIFGKRMERGDRDIVKRYRAHPVEASGRRAKLEVKLGSGGVVERRDQIGCGMWSSVANRVLSHERDFVIAGGTDTGKSSLTVYFLNLARRRGLKTAIIDADLGQGDLGVPGTIGLTIPNRNAISLEAHEPVRIFFVGKTSPYDVEARLEEGIASLYRYSKQEGCQPTITAMHGWLSDPRAIEHVLRVVKNLGLRDLVLLHEQGDHKTLVDEIQTLSDTYFGEIEIYSAPIPKTLKRSSEQRRRIRERKLRSYFQTRDLVVETVDCSRREIQGTGLFEGALWRVSRRLRDIITKQMGHPRSPVIYAERQGNKIKVLAMDMAKREPVQLAWFSHGDLKVDLYFSGRELGLLVGLQKRDGDWSVGRIGSLDPTRRTIELDRPVEAGDWSKLHIGRMAVREDYTEAGTLTTDFFAE
jgi:polynucleotide 5'-hydroxyl-kinase GRC3/NOL9